MAVTTINELIAQRDEIKNKKKQIYEIETSIGTILLLRRQKIQICFLKTSYTLETFQSS